MKKTILMLGLALGAVSTNALANNLQLSNETEITVLDHSPLCKAIIKGDVEAVKKFLEYGSDVNEGENGVTPLMLAARYNQVEIIKMLLKNGADPKQKDENGNDARKYAEYSKATEALELLMRA
ncbi:ankyrin repeat domain-containing protein [Flavobacterium sp.]|uniref:ankyrin repeat domain-containing protein n=1 Tax=Flavobacterium sp. TaxID=239 RepID=UPI003D0F8E70